jgi:ABC-2 type transport system ATP-binding protein
VSVVLVAKNIHKQFRIPKDKFKGIFSFLNWVFRDYEKKEVLKGISFTIKKGEIVGYLGVNGAGKTTTIKILTGVLYPEKGEVTVLGLNPFKERKKFLKKIAVVFGQSSTLVYELPVRDSFKLLKEIYGLSDEFYEKRLNYLLNLFEAHDLMDKQYRTLSLGQKMKVELIAALIHKPEVLFLDEPTIGLDIFNKIKIREAIKKLNKEEGLTILITTHDMEDIEKLCNRIILLNNGKISYDGSLEKFKQKYYGLREITAFYSKIKNEEVFDEIKPLFKKEGQGYFSLEIKVEEINKILNKITEAVEIEDLEVRIPKLEEILIKYFKK